MKNKVLKKNQSQQGAGKVEKFADLHVHTIYSDGTFTPDEVVDTAHKNSLSAIAITDHDSVDGIEPSMTAAKKYGMEIIPGVELTAEEENIEIHILGYFIDWKAGWFEKKLEKMRRARLERIYAMVDKLKSAGVDIDAGKVLKISGPGAIGRLHLATALYNEGIISSINEAFRKYIGDKSPCYVKKYKLSPKEAADMIIKLGGVPVLAHPRLLNGDELITRFIKDGIRGIEAYHTEHAANAVTRYEEMALRNGLLITGGSDCHGAGKGKILLGRVKVPYSLVNILKKEADGIKRQNENIQPGR